MPVHKCPNGKFRIGSGKCQYDSKEKAEKAYKGYMASKHMEIKEELISELGDLEKINKKLTEVKELIKHGSNK